MKIWCCLWFIDDGEDGNNREGTMKEGFLANVDDIEGNIVNDGDGEASAVSLNRTVNGQRQGDETLLPFQENFTSMRYGGNWVDPMWRHSVVWLRSSLGETSSSASATVEDSDHRDSHHKRAKFDTFHHEGTSNNGVFYHNSMLNNGSDAHPFDDNGGKDEEDEGELRGAGFEIRMDLTDDLLHMVFSFLDHRNLCNAAMVCRQWRSASAHEDFWRCLNFEKRDISLEQFDDMCRRYPNATEVNLIGTPSMNHLVMKAVYSLRNLEALTLGKGQIGDAFFSMQIPINHDRLCDLKVTKMPCDAVYPSGAHY
ncbi:hypothetical protein V6N11_049533 [Hibiscus sabdariffa]|uniref:F-box domain-containing protein n=1 Tax=Hibiscus sabdariffa TaxID=183260 RepID=A0ABR2NAQ6_9ROSI